jgi:hypothetical protein
VTDSHHTGREHPHVWPYEGHARDAYWKLVKHKALKELKPPSDGCSGVPDWHVEACWEHDIHYRLGRRMVLIHRSKGGYQMEMGEPITRRWADQRFRSAIRSLSWMAWLTPMALWRFAGVRIAARDTWERYRDAETKEA